MSKKTKQKKVHFARTKSAFNKAGQGVPAVKDAANKLWVLTVVFTLLGAAYVIYVCAEGVPQDLKQYLAGALCVLALMFLFGNLRSVKPANVLN